MKQFNRKLTTNLIEILDNQMQGICVWNQPSRPEMLSSRHTALIDQAAPKVSTGGVSEGEGNAHNALARPMGTTARHLRVTKWAF